MPFPLNPAAGRGEIVGLRSIVARPTTAARFAAWRRELFVKAERA